MLGYLLSGCMFSSTLGEAACVVCSATESDVLACFDVLTASFFLSEIEAGQE